jgi:hypothetical protein
MSESVLELILDGALSRDQVERAIQSVMDSDRNHLGNAFDCGGWNTVAVVFDHRHFRDVIGVRDARARAAKYLDIGLGVALRTVNDAAIAPTPLTRADRATPVTPPLAPAVLAQSDDAAVAADPFDLAMDPNYAARLREAAFVESPEGAALKAQVDAAGVRMRGFATDIIQKMNSQASRTRGCNECGSSIAVTHIKASDGDDGFSTIRCPVCQADRFCIYETDLKRRESIQRHAAKAQRLFDEGLARFNTGEPAREAEIIEVEADEPRSDAEPAHLDEAIPAVEAAPLEVLPTDGIPDTIWIVSGRVFRAAQAA